MLATTMGESFIDGYGIKGSQYQPVPLSGEILYDLEKLPRPDDQHDSDDDGTCAVICQ